MLYGMSLSSEPSPAAEALEAVERARSILEAAVGADPRSEDLQAELADVVRRPGPGSG